MKCFFWRVLEAAERIVLSYAWNKTPHIRQLHVILYINASPRTVTAPVTMIRSALYGLHESSVAFLFDTNRVMMASFVTAKILNFLSGGRANLLRHNFFGTFYIKTKKLSAWAVIQPAQIMLILLLLLIFFLNIVSFHVISSNASHLTISDLSEKIPGEAEKRFYVPSVTVFWINISRNEGSFSSFRDSDYFQRNVFVCMLT